MKRENNDYSLILTICNFPGTGKRIKYGVGAGQLQNAVGSDNVSSIHHAYSDACLIGASIKCDAASAGEVCIYIANK